MISVVVNDQSQVAEARREASAIAWQQGFNEGDAGRVALVTTELGTNLVKHARGGEILAGPQQANGRNGIQILALDKGRGMVIVQACVADGCSSAGTAGQGLGAVVRMSTFVDIASWPGVGTAVLAIIESSMLSVRFSIPPAAQCRWQNRGKTYVVMPGPSTATELRPRCLWLTD